jgi:hypothetical protein
VAGSDCFERQASLFLEAGETQWGRESCELRASCEPGKRRFVYIAGDERLEESALLRRGRRRVAESYNVSEAHRVTYLRSVMYSYAAGMVVLQHTRLRVQAYSCVPDPFPKGLWKAATWVYVHEVP